MADDEPYDMLPHHEIEELKKQVQESKNRSDKSSSQAVVNALEQLTRSMDAMLRLFTEAAHEVKGEDKEHEKIADKLDEIIEQNTTIAEGMLAVSDMVTDFIEKQKHKPMSQQRPMPRPNFPQPAPNFPEPGFQQPEPDFSQPPRFDEFNEQMQPSRVTRAGPQDPVAVPSMPFSDFDLEEKPKKKKGLFGRLKK